MSTIINGTNDAITFPDATIQTTAFKAGAVTQSSLATGVAGTGPTFSAYQSSAQSYSAGVVALVNFQTENWDTSGSFNNTGSTVTLNGLSVPAYAFCPNVAGYYQVNLIVRPNNASQEAQSNIYKNGSSWCAGSGINIIAGTQSGSVASTIVYLNGTGDYVQGYIYTGSSGTGTALNQFTQFSANMVRGA